MFGLGLYVFLLSLLCSLSSSPPYLFEEKTFQWAFSFFLAPCFHPYPQRTMSGSFDSSPFSFLLGSRVDLLHPLELLPYCHFIQLCGSIDLFNSARSSVSLSSLHSTWSLIGTSSYDLFVVLSILLAPRNVLWWCSLTFLQIELHSPEINIKILNQ